MEKSKKLAILIGVSLLFLTGCSRIEAWWTSFRADVEKSAENLKQEAQELKTKYEETKATVEQKTKDIQGAINAVKKLTD